MRDTWAVFNRHKFLLWCGRALHEADAWAQYGFTGDAISTQKMDGLRCVLVDVTERK